MRRQSIVALLVLVLFGAGCVHRPPVGVVVPPPPEEALIEAHIASYQKAKELGDVAVGLFQYRDALGLMADLWYAYTQLHISHQDLEENKNLDLEIAAGETAQAQAERDDAKAARWLWLAVGTAVGIALGVGGMALAL